MDTETRTPRQIVMEMEPLFSDLCNGADAAVALSYADHYEHSDPNGLVFVADAVNALATRLNALGKNWTSRPGTRTRRHHRR